MDFLKRGSHWLERKRVAQMSSRGTYTRRGGQSLSVNLTTGRTRFTEQLAEGMKTSAVRSEVRDFIIAVAELAGGPPVRGESITDEEGRIFDVAEIPVEGHWRYSDEFQQSYRIHTVLRQFPT